MRDRETPKGGPERPFERARHSQLRLVHDSRRDPVAHRVPLHPPAAAGERPGCVLESLVDYRLQRRAVLRDVRRGSIGTYEVCDASPYLLRAAEYFGDQSEIACPICRREPLWRVCFAYGDELGSSAGQACSLGSLPSLARRVGECEIYLVEACNGCGWNHVLEKFLLFTREGRVKPPRIARRAN